MIKLNIAVIGFGITGALLAKRLKDLGHDVQIFDKGKGVGGRIATRRDGTIRYDHGAAFITPPISGLEIPLLTGAQTKVFCDQEIQFFENGMTEGLKLFAKNFDLKLDQKIVEIRKHDIKTKDSLELITEKGDRFFSDRILITAPAPQSVELLKNSNLPVDPSLENIQYDSALVALLPEGSFKSFTKPHSPFRTLIDQKEKGIQTDPASVVVFDAHFSTQHFEKSEDDLRPIMTPLLQSLGFQATKFQIKKWRYAFVKNPTPKETLTLSSTHSIDFFGDGFVGSDLSMLIKSTLKIPIAF